tara:strand:+ start:2481 stop:2957 length:477 start_codon:yes stop_codon:yes gene_type:complete
MGGGILPVAIYKGKLYFLFSREWIKSKEGGKWSDFGGSKEGNESYKETAIREGCEESCGFLGSKKNIENLIDNNTIAEITLNGYRTYLVLIKYDSRLPKRFRDKFNRTYKSKPWLVEERNGLFEKDMLRWYTYEELSKKYKSFRTWYKSIVKDILKTM